MSVDERSGSGRDDSRSLGEEAQDLLTWEIDLVSGHATWSPGCRRLFQQDLPVEVDPELFLRRFHPDDREPMREQMRRALDPSGNGAFAFECRLLQPDGTSCWLDVWARTLFDTVDGQRRAVRLLGTVAEINTTTHRELEAFIESQRWLTSIVDNATGVVWVKDSAGRFLMVNSFTERVMELPREELVGRTVYDLFPPDLAEEYAGNDRRVMESGETITVEESTRFWHGEQTYVSVKFPIRDDEGTICGVGAICTDITERREAEAERERLLEALQEADRRKDHFLAVLSHELRNPLASIRNGVYVLKHTAAGSEPAKRARDVIDRQSRHLVRLVDDLLDVTRITLGRVTLRHEAVELNALVSEVAQDHQAWFDNAGVTLEVHRADSPIYVRGDRTRLAQIFWNLLNNATRCAPPGGHTIVTVAVEAADQAVVRVHDDGEGLSREALESLFTPYSQVRSSEPASHRGLGLGLSLVRTFAELHGGTAEAESPGPGHGSTFTVHLPLEAVTEGTRPAELLPEPLPGARRVLVIDDDVDAAETFRDMLETLGHEVAIATSGAAGVERARSFAPEIVLCDIAMPGMDGYMVAQTMRADPHLQSIHLVAVSGFSQPDDVERSRDAGFARHEAKPLALARLMSVLADAPPRGDQRRHREG